jgi:hypothetical protein
MALLLSGESLTTPGCAPSRTGVNALLHGVLRCCNSVRPAPVGAAATRGEAPLGRRFGGIPAPPALAMER